MLININKSSGIPLIGCIQFGIIDRNTNLLQIRPISLCNLNCPFCSTDSGNCSKHKNEFLVEPSYLIEQLNKIAEFKGNNLIAHIDSTGEPLTHPNILEIVKGIKAIKNFNYISLQTNGILLEKELVKKLEPYINQINLSINSLDKEKSKLLSGNPNYDIEKIKEIAEFISKTKIKLILTPLWLPKINDADIIDLIKFSKELNCKIGIQKYEIHKFGRKMKKAKKLNYFKFYRRLTELEKELGVKLKLGPSDFNIIKTKQLPKPFNKDDIISCIIKSEGWYETQIIAVANGRCITINNCNNKLNERVRVKLTNTKDNIFIGNKI